MKNFHFDLPHRDNRNDDNGGSFKTTSADHNHEAAQNETVFPFCSSSDGSWSVKAAHKLSRVGAKPCTEISVSFVSNKIIGEKKKKKAKVPKIFKLRWCRAEQT